MKKTILTLLIVVMLALIGCSAEHTIIGTWTNQTTILGIDAETTYVFREDGTGSKKTILETDFTYEISGDKLTITTSVLGIESTDEYTVDVSWNELKLTDGDETLIFEKVR